MKHKAQFFLTTDLNAGVSHARPGYDNYMKILNNAVTRLTILYFLLLISNWQKKLINKYGKGCYDIK